MQSCFVFFYQNAVRLSYSHDAFHKVLFLTYILQQTARLQLNLWPRCCVPKSHKTLTAFFDVFCFCCLRPSLNNLLICQCWCRYSITQSLFTSILAALSFIIRPKDPMTSLPCTTLFLISLSMPPCLRRGESIFFPFTQILHSYQYSIFTLSGQ